MSALVAAVLCCSCGGGGGGGGSSATVGSGSATDTPGSTSTNPTDTNANAGAGTSTGTATPATSTATCPVEVPTGLGLGFAGVVQLRMEHDHAGQAVRVETLSVIENSGITGYTRSGTLRMGLWALPWTGTTTPHQDLNGGVLIWRDRLSLNLADGSTTEQLRNPSIVPLSTDGTGTLPAAGTYCLVMTLEQYSKPGDCTSTDNYCIVSSRAFTTANTFR